MRKRITACTVLLLAIAAVSWTTVQRSRMKHPKSGQEITIPGRDGDGNLLASGWRVSPAGRSFPVGDMILSAEFSPDGRTLAFTNTGYGQHKMTLVDVATEKEIASFPIERGWSGLAWSPDGKRLHMSAGVSNPAGDLITFQKWDGNGWRGGRPRLNLWGATKDSTAISAVRVSPDGSLLYALNNSDHHLYVIDTYGGRGVARLQVGRHPIAAKLSVDGKALYVASLGSDEVSIIDVTKPEAPAVTGLLKTDSHPNDLVVTRDGRLFVSCGNSNTVASFDLGTKERLETIHTSLSSKSPAGSTPHSLALSKNEQTLFVANADNNNVAVIDIETRGRSSVVGFIPTGWYPTLVTITPDGKRIVVASGKGMGTGPNEVQRPITKEAPMNFLHHGNRLSGLISFVDFPEKKKLHEYTKQVYANTPYRDGLLQRAEGRNDSIVPSEVGAGSPIQHVLYIIKENRTYDQVFGDLPQGNGDPALVLFGREITPNHHAIAEQFVLFDNLYCNGEVSQDGHPWSTSAYVTEYTQRAWVLGYSGHGRAPRDREVAEQSSPYIWEQAMKRGLKVMAFGYGRRRGLEDKQSQVFDRRQAPDQASRLRDFERADRFVEEFEQMDRENRVPNFMVMSLGEDHTSGTTPGAFTPKAQVASNDYGLGKIVEAVSKSKVWSKSAIFVIEDDPQNGPDHVDSHRTVGLVISPYVKRKQVDSTMYTTASMLRTMELLLGLEPMSQYDAAATPMFNAFMKTPNPSGYKALPPRIDLMVRNSPHGYGAQLSARMNFDAYDMIDDATLNRILWHSIKGEHVPMPAPVRRALLGPNGLIFLGED